MLQFSYDYLGRRVEKLVRGGYNGTSYTTDVAKTRYVYNGWNVVAELNAASSNALLRTYAWGLDLSGSLTDGGGVGGLLAIKDGSTFHLPLYDANGNVHALLNKADGSITAAYEYSPFGETLRAGGSYAATNTFRFSTKQADAETGLLNYGYRYYDPAQGRFLGRDPSGEQGGLNLYAFCLNNAVNTWDVLGMVSIDEMILMLGKDAVSQAIGTNLGAYDSDDEMYDYVADTYSSTIRQLYYDTYGWDSDTAIDMDIAMQALDNQANRMSNNAAAVADMDLPTLGELLGGGGSNRTDDGRTASLEIGKLTTLAVGSDAGILQLGVASSIDPTIAPNSGTVIGATPSTNVLTELNPFNPNGSFAKNAVAVSDSLGGMLGVAWGKLTGNQNMVQAGASQMAGSYTDNVLGQTENGPAWAKYGTRGALVVAGTATAVAAAAGTAELVFFGNQPILVEGLLGGGSLGSGGLVQLRPQGGPPIIRLDFHPIPGSGGAPRPHVDSPPLGWHHWPW